MSDNTNPSATEKSASEMMDTNTTAIKNAETKTAETSITETQITETQITEMKAQFEHLRALSRQQVSYDWQTRLKRLNKLEEMVNDNRDIIFEVINQDFGRRSKSETLMAEVFPVLENIRHAKKHGKDWMKVKKVSTSKWFLPASSYIQAQPLGVVGIISPWNYPLFLTLSPLIGAIVAGNRAMIKLSEHAPHYANWLAKTLPEYFTADEVCVITGETEVSQAFSSLPFDHLIFTGSTAVGRHIMRSASENLTPVTLELGGKSPVIVDKHCDIDYVVSRIWTGKLLNAGQTCISPDYVLLPEGLKDEFIKQSHIWISKHYQNIEHNDDYSHLINQAQFARVQGYLDNAKSLGANVHAMSNANPNAETQFMPPFVVTELAEDSQLLTEEIFAPVLPVVTYTTLDNAIRYVNDRPRPLALYVFSKEDSICEQVLAETVSGGACINDTIYHIAQSELPFGGVGDSGMGHYHGKFGFDTFSHQRAVFKQASINAVGLMQPPYGKVFDKMMKILARG